MSQTTFAEALNNYMYIEAAKILYEEKDKGKIASYIQSFTELKLFYNDQIKVEKNPGLYHLVFIIVLKSNNSTSLTSAFSKFNILFNKNLFCYIITLELLKNPRMPIPASLSVQNEFKQYFEHYSSIPHYIFKDVIDTFQTKKENIQILSSVPNDYKLINDAQMARVDQFCQNVHKQTKEMCMQTSFSPNSFLNNVKQLLTQLGVDLKEPIINFNKHRFALAISETASSIAHIIISTYDDIKTRYINRLNSKSLEDINQVQKDIIESVVNAEKPMTSIMLALLFQLYRLIKKNQTALTTSPSTAEKFLQWCNDPFKSIPNPINFIICVQTQQRDKKIKEPNSPFNQLNHKLSIALSEFSYYFYVKLFETILQCKTDDEAELLLDESDSFKDIVVSKIDELKKHLIFSRIEYSLPLESFEFPCIKNYTQDEYKYLAFYKVDTFTESADTKHCCACGNAYSFICPKCNAKYCKTHLTPDMKCLFCSTKLEDKKK